MATRLIECAANFSEGRRNDVLDAIGAAIAGVPEVRLLDLHKDPDHNRSVFTFAGPPEPVAEAAVRAAGVAASLIDLTQHAGVHPRIGAADVIPFVPIEGVTLEECAALATWAGEQIWLRHRVPVYLYEAAARNPDRRRLEQIRRGGFEKLRDDPTRCPDFGGPALHPTAGASAVGARKFLIAFNINLDTADVTIAKRIASSIRTSSGGFPHVKALGVALESRGQTQVTMNLTDFEVTSIQTVYGAVRDQAAALGAGVAGIEFIGLVPRKALASGGFPLAADVDPGAILENRLNA